MKSNFLKTGVFLLAIVIIFSAFAGCGNGSNNTEDKSADKPATSSVSSTEETGSKEGFTIVYAMGQSRFKEEAHTAIADKMKADHNIEIVYEIIPDSQSINLLQTKLATGEVPDVIDLNIPGQYVTYDVSNFVALDDQPWVSRMVMDKSSLTATDGTLYGMPLTSFSGVLGVIYNKDVFASLNLEIPKTYADFITVMETVNASGTDVTPLYISGKDTWTIQITPMIYLANALDTNAQETYDKVLRNELDFAEIPEYKKALEDFHTLFTSGYTNADYAVATYDSSKEALATGSAAMMVSGEFAANDIIAKWPDANIGMFPLPYNDSEKILTANYVVGISVPKAGTQVDNALKFIDLLSQPEYLELYLSGNPMNSPFTDVESSNLNDIQREMYSTYLDTGKMVPQVSDMISNFGSLNEDIIMSAYVQIAQGGDIDGVIKQIDDGFTEYGKNLGLPEYQ